MDLECHPRRDFHNLVGRDLLEFMGQFSSCFSEFELPRGRRGRSHSIELREFQGEFWPMNLGEISLRVDQYLG